MVQLNYTITKEDYVSYYTFMYWDYKLRKKVRVKNFAKQFVFNLVFCSIIYFSNLLGHNNKFVLLIIALIIATSFLSLLGGRSNVQRQALKFANNEDNASIFSNYSLHADGNGLLIKKEFNEVKYYWKAIIKKLETKNHYFLFENALQAILIPKSAFTNTEQKLAFDKILTKYLSLDAELQGM